MSRARRYAALAVLVLPVLLISMDMTVLGFALPALTTELRPTSSELLWIVDVYSFLLAGLLVLMGNIGDRIGRRRLLVLGAAAFGGASVVAAFATSPEMLIAARALLGLGGATLMPSTLALLRSVFLDAAERRMAIAIWAAAFSGGAALGPVLGGIVLQHFWWGAVFLINAPVMVLLLVTAPLVLPESRNPQPGPFDARSALLSTAGVLVAVYALKASIHDGLDLFVLVQLAVAGALLTVFIRRQRRLPEPLLDLRLFSIRPFTVAVLTNLLTVFALLGLMFFLPQYLMLVLGMSPLTAGLWMLPLASATVIGSLASPWLTRHLPLRQVIAGGMALAAVGFAVSSGLDVQHTPVVLITASVLIGAGVGAAEALTNDVILSVAPVDRAGAAAAISETAYELGGALGTAVLGSVGLAVYAAHLDPGVGVPAAVADSARETLGAATEAAAALPVQTAAAFLADAQQAFVAGMHIVLVAAAVLAAFVSLQALLFLRDRGVPAAADTVAGSPTAARLGS